MKLWSFFLLFFRVFLYVKSNRKDLLTVPLKTIVNVIYNMIPRNIKKVSLYGSVDFGSAFMWKWMVYLGLWFRLLKSKRNLHKQKKANNDLMIRTRM